MAIALYFAILKVRPTPFVVMDEIEAALDEPNVVRVARYMRSISPVTSAMTVSSPALAFSTSSRWSVK